MLAHARGDKVSLHPELTIEPIYKPSEKDGGGAEFDQSKAGRRLSTYIDSEGRLQIKTVCESPEIRNLSEKDSEEGQGSDSGHEETNGKSVVRQRYCNDQTTDQQFPLMRARARGTLLPLVTLLTRV